MKILLIVSTDRIGPIFLLCRSLLTWTNIGCWICPFSSAAPTKDFLKAIGIQRDTFTISLWFLSLRHNRSTLDTSLWYYPPLVSIQIHRKVMGIVSHHGKKHTLRQRNFYIFRTTKYRDDWTHDVTFRSTLTLLRSIRRKICSSFSKLFGQPPGQPRV